MVFHRVPKNRQNAQRTAIPAMYRTCVFVGKRPAQRGKLRLVQNINFEDYESRNYFDQQLRKVGLFARLEEMGIADGDTVDIYDFEFEYQR